MADPGSAGRRHGAPFRVSRGGWLLFVVVALLLAASAYAVAARFARADLSARAAETEIAVLQQRLMGRLDEVRRQVRGFAAETETPRVAPDGDALERRARDQAIVRLIPGACGSG